MMNQQINIQTYNIDVNAFKLSQIFDDYGIVTSYPIDRNKFVLDLLKSCQLDSTMIFDSEGNLVK
jgi:hypothetical protein